VFVHVIVVVHVRGPILDLEKGYQYGHDYDDVHECEASHEHGHRAASCAL